MTTTVRPASDIPRPAPPTKHQTRTAASLSTVISPKRLARIAGVLYLFVGIFGGFDEAYVEPKMYVAGDASATAGNVVANAGLVRLGVVSDLLDQTFFAFLALTLYELLKHVHQSVASWCGTWCCYRGSRAGLDRPRRAIWQVGSAAIGSEAGGGSACRAFVEGA
jgi:Domain of unknown function (DUF4386)